MESLTPDGGVTKRVECAGEGSPPSGQARVWIHYTVRELGGKVLESSRDANKEFSFRLGREKVILGLEILVRSMTTGEIAVGQVSGHYLPKERGFTKPIEIEVRLINIEEIESNKTYLRMTPQERLEAATAAKEAGNRNFKEAKYSKAMVEYQKARDYLYYVFVDENGKDFRKLPKEEGQEAAINEEEIAQLEDMVKKVKVSTFINLALCYSKEGSNKKVIQCANDALAIDPDNAKALFHRGMARTNLGETDRARVDLTLAVKQNPNDVRIKNELSRLEKKISSDEKRAKRAYGAMFAAETS